MTIAINTLTVDCHDPRALAAFWSAALDWPILSESDAGAMIAPFTDRHPGVFPVYFQRNPDDKVVKNRWHLDLAPTDQAAEVARLEALGATRIDVGQRADQSWVVMADPDGNEFDVLRAFTEPELDSLTSGDGT